MNISSINKQNNQTKLKKVYIYLRNYKKIANLVSVYTPITNHQLKIFISKQLLQSEQTFALFINGLRIDAFPQENSNLKNKSIIHVVNLDRTNTQHLNIYFKFAKESNAILKVKTTPNTIIKSVFEKEILPFFHKNEKQIFLAYLGKAINIFKTFQQEYIEDECQILLLEFKKQVIKQLEMHQSYYQSKHEININKTVVVGQPAKGGRDQQTTIFQQQKLSEKNQLMKLTHMKTQQKQQTTAPQQQKIQTNSSLIPSDCAPSQSSQNNSTLQPKKYSFYKPNKKQQTAPFIKKKNIPQQIKQQ